MFCLFLFLESVGFIYVKLMADGSGFAICNGYPRPLLELENWIKLIIINISFQILQIGRIM